MCSRRPMSYEPTPELYADELMNWGPYISYRNKEMGCSSVYESITLINIYGIRVRIRGLNERRWPIRSTVNLPHSFAHTIQVQ